MADKKISALTALIQANVDTTADVLPIVDTNATETKKVTPAALVGAAAAAGLTNVDINSGTIDGATIATSDITVGAGKTLNVSAGTLTLADNQISGDKVEGGTINAVTINTLTSTTVNATTVDATNVEVTNVKAKDGTAAIVISDTSGNVGLSANLNFTGTGQRITGDMTTTAFANRLSFQTTQANGVTSITALPNGTGVASNINCYNNSDPTNSALLIAGASSTDITINSTIRGTGTYLPMTFFTGGSERVRIDTSGNVGIGGTADATTKLNLLGTYPTSGTVTRGIMLNGTIPSGSTAFGIGYTSLLNTQAASFTLSNLYHYQATQGSIGAGSAVTNQFGFIAESTLTGATNNYGFYSNIASGSNRWNLYCAGTAENYVANNLKIGGTAARATTAGTNQLVLFDGTAPVGTLANGVSFYSASGEANVMDAAGNATLLSPHDAETNEWIFRSKHTPTGKVLKIDVEKMLRFINEHFDLDMVQEWTE